MKAELLTFPDRKVLRSGECNRCQGEARCCKFMVLPLARVFSADETKWAALHGVRVEGDTAFIDIQCSALDGDRCTLYGTPERPEMCVRYPELPEQLVAGCSIPLLEV